MQYFAVILVVAATARACYGQLMADFKDMYRQGLKAAAQDEYKLVYGPEKPPAFLNDVKYMYGPAKAPAHPIEASEGSLTMLSASSSNPGNAGYHPLVDYYNEDKTLKPLEEVPAYLVEYEDLYPYPQAEDPDDHKDINPVETLAAHPDYNTDISHREPPTADPEKIKGTYNQKYHLYSKTPGSLS